MKIVNIVPQAPCDGPLTYLVVWDCPHCSHRHHFGRRVSLLPPEDHTCAGCSATVRYTFPADWFAARAGNDLNEAVEMDQAAHAAILDGKDADFQRLGHNLIYALSAKQASNIRRFPL